MKNSNILLATNSLFIKAVTWSRDSHGLYDYESRNVQKKQIQTSSSCYLCRIGTDVQQVSNLADLIANNECTPLCMIEQDNSEYSIKPLNDPLWLVVRTMKNNFGSGCVLKEGYVIKLGRASFKITTLRNFVEVSPSANTQDSDESDCEIPNERENGICRICLYNDFDSTNPLISPCSCAGSMKYIHLSCLQQ